MDLLIEAVKYFISVTGKEWYVFYDLLESGDWLVTSLLDTVINNSGMNLDQIKQNKDAVKGVFDNDSRKQAGEFFTPVVWAEELHKYLDKYEPSWREEFYVWEPSAGSGNLIRTAGIEPSHLFASTLQEDDVTMLKATPELKDATVFQLDFLAKHDDMFNRDFVDNLPKNLQDVIKNNKPLVMLCNPPYKGGMANVTDVGRYMSNSIPYLNHTDFSQPAYDLFYQFMFQMLNFQKLYNLTNMYIAVFHPLTWFTLRNPLVLLHEFRKSFEYLDGMCISAGEFSGTSESIPWGIGATLWKTVPQPSNNPILLDKMHMISSTEVEVTGKVLYEEPRERLTFWTKDTTSAPLVELPVMTSHLTFAGGEPYEKVAHKFIKVRNDIWGSLMPEDTLTRSALQSGMTSMPSSSGCTIITPENFWRAVANFVFRQVYTADWTISKKKISAPNTGIAGYSEWVQSCIPLFLFEHKSMVSALRGVVREDELNLAPELRTLITVRNHFFPLSQAEIADVVDDTVRQDMQLHPETPAQQFMQRLVRETRQYWSEASSKLYDWCINYILSSYSNRAGVEYKGSLESWDASFSQIKYVLMNEEDANTHSRLLQEARAGVLQGALKFGFVVEGGTDEFKGD